jgi:hypothetical protein
MVGRVREEGVVAQLLARMLVVFAELLELMAKEDSLEK